MAATIATETMKIHHHDNTYEILGFYSKITYLYILEWNASLGQLVPARHNVSHFLCFHKNNKTIYCPIFPTSELTNVQNLIPLKCKIGGVVYSYAPSREWTGYD